MPWQKLDDKLYRNPKLLGLSDGAFRLLVYSWSFCADQAAPNGFLTHLQAQSLVALLVERQRHSLVRELVRANCWEEVSGGYLLHDFEDYIQIGSRDRVRRWRARQRHNGNVTGNATSNGEGNADVTPRARAQVPEPEPEPVGDEVTPSVESSYPPVVPPPNALGAKAPNEGLPGRVLERWQDYLGRPPTGEDQQFAEKIPYAFDRLSAGEVLDEIDRLVGKFADKPPPPLKYLAGRLSDLNTQASENGRTSRHITKPGMQPLSEVLKAVQRRATG